MEVLPDNGALQNNKPAQTQSPIFKEVKYWEVDYQDLEELIKSHYGVKGIDLVVMCKWRNDTKVTVSAEDFGSVEPEVLQEMIKKPWHWRDNCFGLSDVLFDLVGKGIVPEGELLITVSW